VDALTELPVDFEFVRVSPCEPDVARLIDRHFALMRAQTPDGSCHVLPASALDTHDMRLFALRRDGTALAIGAMRIDGHSAELKSMHTAEEARRRGLGRRMLAALLDEARRRGLHEVLLETGSGVEHAAARALYASAGFCECPAFGHYVPDPLSVFMARAL
jgi:putative acetyltransferase